MDTSTLPIGVFDSGVGGLTVLQALRQRLPYENLVYLGDTARLPYGSKSPETVVRYALQVAARLVEQRIKMLVVACNTASAVALPALRERFAPVPVVGVVEPGAHAACQASQHGHIAVIATESTIHGGAYPAAIHALRPNAQVRSLACPLFVPLAEEGWFNGSIVEAVAKRYLDPLFASPATAPDCLVLGCTHYPLLAKAIRNVVGPTPVLVDSAATTATVVADLLTTSGIARSVPAPGASRFFTTDDAPRFARTGTLFLGRELCIDDVELVDL